MTTINYPKSGGFLQQGRVLIAAALGAALVTIALLMQILGGSPTTTTANVSAADLVVADNRPSALLNGAAFSAAIADVLEDAAVGVEPSALLNGEAFATTIAESELEAELAAIRAGTERSVPVVDSRQTAFLAMNEIPWAPAVPIPATANSTNADLSFFLSINDVEIPSANMANGDRAFFLSINDVQE